MQPPAHSRCLNVLKVRDRQVSAGFGLPIRIRDEEFSVPMLQLSDLEDEGLVTRPDIFVQPPPTHKEYLIEMINLARLCTTSPTVMLEVVC